MKTDKTIQDMLLAKIISRCKEKCYQVKQSSDENKIRLDISNFTERTIANIFNTGTIQIQGRNNSLKEEMLALKETIESMSGMAPASSIDFSKACTAIYDIMLMDLRERVKGSLREIAPDREFIDKPSQYIDYRAKISTKEGSITITQFSNGKITLQGKTDLLFDRCCDQIEKLAQPSGKEIAARFVCTDQEILEAFVAQYTPELINYAEKEARDNLGNSFLYLETYDQKWYIASRCLCRCCIVLPEYSPFVMPSSKAFEGFSKKLIIDIGLVPSTHFSSKTANFGILNDISNPSRKAVCLKDKYVDTHLDKLKNSLDIYRNFMMHSDDSFVTKVETPEKAFELVEGIMKTQREIFDYFNAVFKLMA